jgi:cell division protein FtsW (lipid II flippase)
MKTLIKLLMSILMPNFGIALMIRNTIRDAETAEKILTRAEIEGMYYISILILLIPIILSIICMFFDLKRLTEWLPLGGLGVIISVIFIFTNKDLKN